jgi:hypothetical protein
LLTPSRPISLILDQSAACAIAHENAVERMVQIRVKNILQTGEHRKAASRSALTLRAGLFDGGCVPPELFRLATGTAAGKLAANYLGCANQK